MQPNQPVPPANAGGPNPYDFILKEPPKKRGLLPSGNSTSQRILIVVGGGLALIVVFIVIFLVIFSSSNSGTASIKTLSQEQYELIRVSTNISHKARNEPTAGFANTIQYSLISDQKTTLAYLGKHGGQPKTKYLALTQNPDTDKTLSSAELAGDFDTVATETLKTQLEDYQKDIAAAFKSSTSLNQKSLLNTLYVHVSALLKNPPQALDETSS